MPTGGTRPTPTARRGSASASPPASCSVPHQTRQDGGRGSGRAGLGICSGAWAAARGRAGVTWWRAGRWGSAQRGACAAGRVCAGRSRGSESVARRYRNNAQPGAIYTMGLAGLHWGLRRCTVPLGCSWRDYGGLLPGVTIPHRSARRQHGYTCRPASALFLGGGGGGDT